MIFYRNIKNQKLYKVIDTLVINANDKEDGRDYMVLYKDEKGHKFVKDRTEFYKKYQKTNALKFI